MPRSAAQHSDVEAFCLRYTQNQCQRHAFLTALRMVQMRYPERLYFKAILWLEEQDKPVVVHGVHDQLYPIMNLPAWPTGELVSEPSLS